MADEEQLRILRREGVAVWNRWRAENWDVRPEFNGANFREVDLHGANLREANLCRANLQGTNLGGAYLWLADLVETDLREANLNGADLRQANLSRAHLHGAHLSGADLCRADLRWADLSGAHFSASDIFGTVFSDVDPQKMNFEGAELGWTVFGNVDLSDVKGLEAVRHRGPSTIGIDTVVRSRGRIPEVFLRGCGVPDEVIASVRSWGRSAIEFYSCFISYSSKDQEFAERLHADLQAKGVRCWFAPEDLKIGDKIWDRLDQSIRLHDKLLVILSGNSIGSEWVEDEVTTAFEEERKREKTVLFPVRLDDAVMRTEEAWAGKVRQRHIGDFRAWKEHDAYRQAFERLVRDLKAGERE